MVVTHVANWFAGWGMILAAFVTGGAIGLFFHREQFWGGYASFRRRIVRRGHIGLAALGMIKLVSARSPRPAAATGMWAVRLWIVGGLSMPVLCFLCGWRVAFRHLFVIPVGALSAAVILTLIGA